MHKSLILLSLVLAATVADAQQFSVTSPDGHIVLNVDNSAVLSYSASLDGVVMIAPSAMGFEFSGEAPMRGNFTVLGDAKPVAGVEEWTPVVRNKHAHCRVPYNELTLHLRESSETYRDMQLTFRVMDDGIAFRYTLYGTPSLGNRQVLRELTTFRVPEGASLWIPGFEYYDKEHPYRSSQEGEFIQTPVSQIQSDIHAGLPGLIEVDAAHWMAILEADLDHWPAFYLGRHEAAHDGYETLCTRLTPIYGESEDGVKARFDQQQNSSWRIVMLGHNPGRFIESEIVRSLNPDCAIQNTSWIKPGMSAWDHWWSGEVKMEQSVILQYIDLAAREGWPYMLIDWTWYGPYCVPKADITQPAPQLDMPAIIRYATEHNVGIWLWLRCEDANHNDQYREAFRRYHQWGVKGVKIDFMDRDDQDMVCWYRRIIQATADNELMLDFHGAYKPDGIERTYPNMLTREGVMGAEYYKWSDRVTPEHNVKLAYTRLLAGQMDYTPGGFINVTAAQHTTDQPAQVTDTRAAELAKFVIYESPYMVVCDHPDNICGQTGEDFLHVVPTTWDDIRFLGGSPDSYVAIAKRSGTSWYIAVLNDSNARDIELDLSPLGIESAAPKCSLELWQDGRRASRVPSDCEHRNQQVVLSHPLRIRLAGAGGYVGILRP